MPEHGGEKLLCRTLPSIPVSQRRHLPPQALEGSRPPAGLSATLQLLQVRVLVHVYRRGELQLDGFLRLPRLRPPRPRPRPRHLPILPILVHYFPVLDEAL